MKAKRKAWCDCAEKVNENLKEQHEELDASFVIYERTFRMLPRIAKMRVDGAPRRRGNRTTLLPNYCPFCGVKYPSLDRGAR